MRWLFAAALVLTVLPSMAAAERLVIEEPGMYYQCPGGKKWDDVAKCLKKHGRPEVVRSLLGAKLVRLDQQENAQWVDGGIYLYVERKGEWKIHGTFFGRGTDYELLEFKSITIGSHTGHRIDIGQATPLWVQLDGVTTTQALRRSTQTLFCGGVNQACTHTTQNCEVLVRGRAYWTFRGDMKISGNDVTIAGDRRAAGPFCAQAERVFLGWPQT
jgi:hypothetical protein